MRFRLISLLLVLPAFLWSQDFEGLYSVGRVPADLQLSYRQLYSLDKQRAKTYNNGRLRNRTDLQLSSYVVTRLLSGGRILYGDSVTLMVQRVADELLSEYPAVRDSLRFYCVKSANVNAFSTGQGMIFVNLGLIARCSNEAELAFILSHEIAHWYCNHTWEELRQKKNQDQLEEFLSYHRRSRVMETQADSVGLQLFYNPSPYAANISNNVFDMLQYAYLPLAEKPFPTTFFNTNYYQLPASYCLETLKPISARDDYIDSLSTHPNIIKRRTATQRLLSNAAGDKYFVVTTETEFERLRKVARMECLRQDYISGRYSRVFFNAFTLLNDSSLTAVNGDNYFIHKIQAQALYAIAKHKTYTKNNNSVISTNQTEGQEQQAVSILRSMTADEVSLQAIRKLWLLHNIKPSDDKVLSMLNDLRHDLYGELGLTPSFFKITFDTASLKSSEIQPSSKDKYARIRRQRAIQSQADLKPYIFVDLFEADSSFASWLFDTSSVIVSSTQSVQQPKGLMLLSPSYYVYDSARERLKVSESDAKEIQMTNALTQVAKQQGLSVVDFSASALQNNQDVNFYNHYALVSEWTNEFAHIDKNVTMVQSVTIDSVSNLYGADLVNVATVLNAEGHSSYRLRLFSVLYSIPLFPLFVPWEISTLQETEIYSTTINTHTKKNTSYHQFELLNDNPHMVKAELYGNIAEAHFQHSSNSYLGRRFALSAGVGVGFPWVRIGEFKNKSFDLRPTVGISYILGHRCLIHGSFDWTTTHFGINHEGVFDDVSAWTALASVRYSLLDIQSPVGPYMGIGFSLTHVDLKATNPLAYLSSDKRFFSGFSLEGGYNIPITDRFLLNFSGRYTFTFALPMEKMDFSISSASSNAVNARRSFNSAVWAYNAIVFGVNVCFLPL